MRKLPHFHNNQNNYNQKRRGWCCKGKWEMWNVEWEMRKEEYEMKTGCSFDSK